MRKKFMHEVRAGTTRAEMMVVSGMAKSADMIGDLGGCLDMATQIWAGAAAGETG